MLIDSSGVLLTVRVSVGLSVKGELMNDAC